MYESVAWLPCGEVTVAKLPCDEVTGNQCVGVWGEEEEMWEEV